MLRREQIASESSAAIAALRKPQSARPDRRCARGFPRGRGRPAPRRFRATSVRPVSAARSGCATLPSFTPSLSAKAFTAASIGATRPVGDRRQDAGSSSPSILRASASSSASAAASRASGRSANEESGAVDQVVERLGAFLEVGQRGLELGAPSRASSRSAKASPCGRCGSAAVSDREQRGRRPWRAGSGR